MSDWLFDDHLDRPLCIACGEVEEDYPDLGLCEACLVAVEEEAELHALELLESDEAGVA